MLVRVFWCSLSFLLSPSPWSVVCWWLVKVVVVLLCLLFVLVVVLYMDHVCVQVCGWVHAVVAVAVTVVVDVDVDCLFSGC